jgi:hypothetical protein
MFNFYLYNKSYEQADAGLIESNIRDLNDLVIVDRRPEDSFLKNDALWYIETKDGIFSDVVFSKLEDKQLSYTVIPKLFEAITSIDEEFSTLEEFDNSPYRIYNAFYGAVFNAPGSERYITGKASYTAFKEKYLWEDLTAKSLWERRGVLFSRVMFCPSVENNLKQPVVAAYLPQIVDRLAELDRYAATNWTSGDFNYHDANACSSLRISPESRATMNQARLHNLRIFSLPDGRRECFDLHIKTGDLRFHFYPENGKIYVGYIGSHLSTATSK